MKLANSVNCTGMGVVDQKTRDLLEWQDARQQASTIREIPSTPQRVSRFRQQRDEDVIDTSGPHQTSGADQMDDGEADTMNETDEDDKTDGDYSGESEEDSEDSEEERQPEKKQSRTGSVRKRASSDDLTSSQRQSPQHRHATMEGQIDTTSFSSPSHQPYYQYGQFSGVNPQAQITGPANGVPNFLPQTGIAPMAIMTHPQNGLHPENFFYPEIGPTHFDHLGVHCSPERSQVVPFRSPARPDLPQPPRLKRPRKGRKNSTPQRGKAVTG
jgi:hypothetical protein